MKAPRLTGKQILAALRRAGFVVVNVEGSHHQLRRVQNGQRVGRHRDRAGARFRDRAARDAPCDPEANRADRRRASPVCRLRFPRGRNAS